MDKKQHGRLLASAMESKRIGRDVLADLIGKGERTITNYRNGTTMPSEAERALFRTVLGTYDAEGDPVEVALDNSELNQWRATEVKALYQRHLHDQRREEAV